MQNRVSWKCIGRGSIGLILFCGWIYVLLYMTLLGRSRTVEPKMELTLFWSTTSAWVNKDAVDWYFVIGNILLFIPLGWILPTYFLGFRKYSRVVITGLFFSAMVEGIQLVEHLGWFEYDDLFHNTLGSALGYGLFVFSMWIVDNKNGSKVDKWIAGVLWMGVLGFFIAAYAMGQPLFEAFKTRGLDILKEFL